MKIFGSLLRNPILSSLTCNFFMKKMKPLHNSESGSCYIFGNGSSLKDINFDDFSDLPAIGCNLLFLHNDVSRLDLKYYTFLDPMKSMGKNYAIFFQRFNAFTKREQNVTFFVSPYDRFRLKQ